jgi:hypothetical protein
VELAFSEGAAAELVELEPIETAPRAQPVHRAKGTSGKKLQTPDVTSTEARIASITCPSRWGKPRTPIRLLNSDGSSSDDRLLCKPVHDLDQQVPRHYT